MPRSKLADIISGKDETAELFVKNILCELAKRGWTKKDLARKSGITPPTIYKKFEDPGTFKLSDINLICRALKVNQALMLSGNIKVIQGDLK